MKPNISMHVHTLIYYVMNLTTVIIIFLIFDTAKGSLDLNMINSYVKEKSLHVVTIYGCFPKKDQLDLLNAFSDGDFSINIVYIDEFSREDEKLHFSPIGCILDGDCEDVGVFLAKASDKQKFGRRYKWLVIANSSAIIDKFRNLNLYVDADIHVAIPTNTSGLTKNWTIFDLYNPAFERGGELRVVQLGYFSGVDGYNAKRGVSKYTARKNMSDVTLKTKVVLPVPFEGSLSSYLHSDENPEINTFNRFHHRVVDNCRKMYNYSVDIQHETSWGYKNEDGTFDGMVGALQRRYIDFGSSPLFVRADRGRVIDYGRNTWILKAAFLFLNQRAVNPVRIYLDPLSTSIWISLILCSILGILLIKLMLHFGRSSEEGSESIESWSSVVMFSLSAACQQGTMHLSDTTSVRIAMVFIYLLSLLMYQCYTASIVAKLLIIPNATITTVEGIVKSSMKVGCEDILYEKDYLKYTVDPWHRRLYEERLQTEEGAFLAAEEGLQRVAEGDYAFNVELATAYPVIRRSFSQRALCQLVEVQMLSTQPMHANYQKGSSLRDILDVCLQRVAECGILQKERSFWHPKKPPCIRSSQSITINVELSEFTPPLVVLSSGVVASLLVLLVELVVDFRRRRAERNSVREAQRRVNEEIDFYATYMDFKD